MHRGAAVALWCAAASARPLGRHESRRCPRVFVYDLPEIWDFSVALSKLGELPADAVLGKKCVPGLPDEYQTEQTRLLLIVLWRLARGGRCVTQTADPAAADLFLVPTFPGATGTEMWGKNCAKPANRDLAARLEHLDERTAHRHLFIVGKGHFAPGSECAAWWRAPEGLLRRSMRFA